MAVVADKSMLEAYGREDLEAFLFTVMGVVSVVTSCSGWSRWSGHIVYSYVPPAVWVEWAYCV